jgi:hypothetical protein
MSPLAKTVVGVRSVKANEQHTAGSWELFEPTLLLVESMFFSELPFKISLEVFFF